MSLRNATRSEVTKQFSTMMWWILALVLVVYVGSTTGGLAFVMAATSEGVIPSEAGLPVPDDAGALLYSFASSLGYVFALLIGTLMVTTEIRHATLTPTFLAVPRRGIALLAKLAAGAVLGLLYGALALAAAVIPAAGVLALFGQGTGLGDSATWAMFGRILIALVLWTVMGIGVGALVRNQVAAVVGVIAFTQFLEPIIRLGASLIDGAAGLATFLPGGASDTLVGASFYALAGAGVGTEVAWWVGGLILAGYTAVFLALGWLFSWRRDIS